LELADGALVQRAVFFFANEASLGQGGNPPPSKSGVIQKLTGLTCDLECPVIDAMKFFLIQQGAVSKKTYFLRCRPAVGVCAQRLHWLGLAWLPGGVLMISEREVRLRRVSRDFQFGFGSSSKSGAIHRDVCVGPDGLVYTDRFAGTRFFRLEALRAFFGTYAQKKGSNMKYLLV
jgi:hypothetical protein